MPMTPILLAAVLVMVIGLVLIPFGLPGLWLMVATVLGLALAGQLSWTLGLTLAGAAFAAELAEFLVLRAFGRAYGGSREAFWGAIAGGMVGLFMGVPVPLVGPLITAFLGTFAGAGLVTYWETRSLQRSARVGWGVVLARTVAVGIKIAIALLMLAAVVFALLL